MSSVLEATCGRMVGNQLKNKAISLRIRRKTRGNFALRKLRLIAGAFDRDRSKNGSVPEEGWSKQVGFADWLGVKHRLLVAYENGERQVPDRVLRDLGLKIGIDWKGMRATRRPGAGGKTEWYTPVERLRVKIRSGEFREFTPEDFRRALERPVLDAEEVALRGRALSFDQEFLVQKVRDLLAAAEQKGRFDRAFSEIDDALDALIGELGLTREFGRLRPDARE